MKIKCSWTHADCKAALKTKQICNLSVIFTSLDNSVWATEETRHKNGSLLIKKKKSFAA